ncbi:MAG: hypothetical protein C5B51_17230 [Terriglobia bacterium]|nr:MAG: hypothetical protein C5B51_17230 [Terriglobia bacterium]
MPSYISSQANRFYAALEASYGAAPAIQSSNRIPALKLKVQHQLEVTERKDKTGSRTFPGLPVGARRRTNFELRTYLTTWQKGTSGPGYGPLFQSALGGPPRSFPGGTVSSANSTGTVTFTAAHNLEAGQGISSAGEIRFVAAIVDPSTVQLNAPFVTTPAAGGPIAATVTYTPSTDLPSVTLFDYWSPTSAVQRILCGVAVDQVDILVNGDYHEFDFSGVAQDVLDSSSFSAGDGQLQSFPTEPPLASFDYTIVPGNMGQAWLGSSPTQFFTLTNATVSIKNGLDTRAREFGSTLPRAICPGQRSVTASFDLHSLDDDATKALYQSARQQSPVSVMFQLGELEGQAVAVNLKSVIPEVPEFDDSQTRLQWRFRASRAQGTIDDEIAVAFA